MSAYQLSTNGVIRNADGAFIPQNTSNADWQSYQSWLQAGNTPDPIPAPVVNIVSTALQALTKSDVTILRCLEKGTAVPVEWENYRTTLRSIISAGSGALPALPTYPSGT